MPEPTPAPVHACPPRGSGLMPCCCRSPVEVPGERVTTNPEFVTCGGDVGPTPAGTVDKAAVRDAELQQLRAQVERVRKLAEEWQRTDELGAVLGFDEAATCALDALDQPQEQP